MSFYVYMLASIEKKPVTYVGYTNDLKKRIMLHNSGKGAKFTRGRIWELIFKQKYSSKKIAMREENKLKKNYRLRKYIKLRYLNKN